MMKRFVWAVGLASLTLQAFATEILQLKDGRSVQLNDDFTWHYVSENPAGSTTSVAVVPVILQPTLSTVTVKVGDNRPILQLSDSGVDVVLSNPRYEQGKLKLDSAITNQSSQAVIAVRLTVRVQDAQGVWCDEQEVTVWQSIKRMAETYLRPHTSVAGKPLEFIVDQQPEYPLHVTIQQVETR
ncbi:ribonuclease [Vibrio metoecus]|nr:ribonuclease [Vibrio metoecus]